MLPVVVAEDNTTTVGPYTSASPLLSLFIPNARQTRTSITNPAVRNVSDILPSAIRRECRLMLWAVGLLCGDVSSSC